jgi:transcriptional regulator with XRE-family HTH domain
MYCQQQTVIFSPDTSSMETLAERLRQERERLGWSQTDLARRSGVKQSFIGALEARNQESSGWLPELAHALGVDTYWLKTGKGRRIAKELTADEALIIAALPLVSPDMREMWLESARRAVARNTGKPDALCA